MNRDFQALVRLKCTNRLGTVQFVVYYGDICQQWLAEGALESSSPIADWMSENACSTHYVPGR